jgi:hypothetical protein
LSINGEPLSPTSPARARMLIKKNKAKSVWSKFNTFGIQMLVSTGKEIPVGVLAVDNGTKFEGYSVVIGNENILNIKLNLPDKKKIVDKLIERRQARRSRRSRLRRREARFNNRSRKDFIVPSQNMLVEIRINMIKNICKLYSIKYIGIEDICFNHSEHRWGVNFSTVEIGKNKIRQFIHSIAKLYEYKGYETKELRDKFGYKKISDKSSNCFESHCCDSLAIAAEISAGERIEPLKNIIVADKTYLPVRRKIHDSNYSKGGIKKDYSRSTVKSIQKGRKVGYKGIEYILSGINKGRFTITGIINRKYRNYVSNLSYISSQYIIA